MWNHVKSAVSMLPIWTLVSGVAWPLLLTGIAQTVFSGQADDSILSQDNKPIASARVGRASAKPNYFPGRLSATSPFPDHAAASSGVNPGPGNPALLDAGAARLRALREADPDKRAPLAVDRIAASGGGLDRQITPGAAEYQINRIVRARRLSLEQVREILSQHKEPRQLGVLSEPRVDVLSLHLALEDVHQPLE